MNLTQIESLISHLYEGAYIVDPNRRITFWNNSSERISGFSASEVINNHCYNNMLQHVDANGRALCFGGCPLHRTLQTGEIVEAKVFMKHKSGYRIPIIVKTIPILDNNTIIGAIEFFSEENFIKDINLENQKLKDELMKDSLTQIFNRRYFDFFISKIMDESLIFGTKFGVLVLDIDLFKNVNDAHGHLIGDEVLKVTAKSLEANIRKTDLISRWGGEEFIGIFRVESISELETLAEKLRIVVEQSSYINNTVNIRVTISVGGTLFVNTDNVHSLVLRADNNMYEAKKLGRNRVVVK